MIATWWGASHILIADGSLLWMAARDSLREILLWDYDTKTTALRAHAETRCIAAGHEDGKVTLTVLGVAHTFDTLRWDVIGLDWGENDEVYALDFLGNVSIQNLHQQQSISVLQTTYNMGNHLGTDICTRPGHACTFVANKGRSYVFDTRAQGIVSEFGSNHRNAAWSNIDNNLVWQTRKGRIELWDMRNLCKSVQQSAETRFTSIDVVGYDRLVSTVLDGTLCIDGEQVAILEPGQQKVQWCPDESSILCCNGNEYVLI